MNIGLKIDRYQPLLISVLLLPALTKYYLISYVLLAALLATRLNTSKIFDSWFGRFVLSFLIAIGAIMITAYIAWIFKVSLHPVAPALFLILMVTYLGRTNTKTTLRSIPLFNKSDFISLMLSLFTPALIYASFFAPSYSDAALYQFLSNGWDNTNHIVMLQTASNESSYQFGKFSDIGDKTIIHSGSYPQAWHLSTALLANGFGSKAINEESPIATMRWLFALMIGWFVVSVYLFAKISIFFKNQMFARTNTNSTAANTVTFVSILFVSVITVTGSLVVGHGNYLGLAAFVLALIAYMIESSKLSNTSAPLQETLTITSILATSAILCWFLPMPAILTTLALFFFTHINRYRPTLKSATNLIVPVLIVSFSALPLIIYLLYGSSPGVSSLIAPGGQTISISPLLLYPGSVIILYCLKDKIRELSVILLNTLPMFILSALIYMFQMITIGYSKYYYEKTSQIVALTIGLLLAPTMILAISYLYNNVVRSYAVATIGSLCLLAALVMTSGQSLLSLNSSLQRSSVVTYGVAEKIISYLNSDERKHSELLVYTQKDVPLERSESMNGNLVTQAQHKPLTCAHDIISEGGENKDEVLGGLSDCASTLNKPIYVIVSDETRDLVRNIESSNIRIWE